MPLVVAFDPGNVTGWSSWVYDDQHPMARDEYGLIKGGVQGFIEWSSSHHYLLREATAVVEHYVPDGGPQESITPIQIEGALACALYYLAMPPAVEQRRSVKRQVPDRVLKEQGLWLEKTDPAIDWKDARDVHDSEIHALAYAKLLGHAPTIEMLWPDR